MSETMRPKPQLPDEPGLWGDKDDGVWLRVNGGGTRRIKFGDDHWCCCDAATTEELADYAPFHPLKGGENEMNSGLTDDMVYMATLSMLVVDCGMHRQDAINEYERWLRSLKAEAWTEGWEEGQFYEAALAGGRTKEQAQAKDLRDSPYLKKKS